jgi:uncharacterized membrane protein
MQESGEEALELGERLARMERELRAQRGEMAALRAELLQLKDAAGERDYVVHPPKPAPASTFVPPPPPPLTVPVPVPPPVQASPPVIPQPAAPPPPVPLPPPPSVPSFAYEPAAPPRPNPAFNMFSEFKAPDAKPVAHRSVENRIGSQLFNRIGIVAVLVGVALFLKYAYDNHWIHTTPTGRITGLLVVGAGVVLWSEWLRRKGYAAFSYSLKAIGTGTLYMSLWASFHIYHLLPAGEVLTAMIGVTAWNAIMAWAQDSELLAAYALVGGFATPALVGSGGNHETFLFSYVLAMDLAVLFWVCKKPWQRLLLGSFPSTVTYFIGWYTKFFIASEAGVTGLFAVLLALPFMAVPLFGKQREDGAEGVIAPFAAASFMGCALYSVLEDSGRHAWLPWFAVALAVVYLLLMRVRRNGLAEAMHLALAVVFLTIAIPLKAEGRWITIGWLAEGVALIWVAAKLLGPTVQPRVRTLMRWLGCAALALGVGDSLIFWAQQNTPSAFWNARFATEMSAVGALALAAWLARHPANQSEPEATLNAPKWSAISLLCTLGCHIIAPLAVARELTAFWAVGVPADADYRQQLCAFSIASFLMVYAACLVAWLAFGREKQSVAGRQMLIGWISATYLALGFITMIVMPTVGDGNPVRVFFNERVIFQMCGVAALALVAWFARLAILSRESETTNSLSWPLLNLQCTLGAHLAAALAGAREISAYWSVGAVRTSAYRDQLHVISIAAFLMIYGACLVAWVALRPKTDESRKQRKMLRVLGCIYLAIGSLGMIVTPIVGDGGPVNVFWNARLLLEMVGALALAVTAWLAWRVCKIEGEKWGGIAAVSFVIFNLLVVLAGVHEIFAYFGVSATGDAGLAEAFSISAWLMVYAAALLAAGFWRRTAFVRWQGLGLLVFTIGKVFLYDMHTLSSGYRILSVFGLGALLMTVSFAYQKDWLRLREDEPSVDNVDEVQQ